MLDFRRLATLNERERALLDVVDALITLVRHIMREAD